MTKKIRNADSGGIMTTYRTPDKKPDEDSEEDMGKEALKAAAQDILRAISQNDHMHLVEALNSYIDIKNNMSEAEEPSDEQDSE